MIIDMPFCKAVYTSAGEPLFTYTCLYPLLFLLVIKVLIDCYLFVCYNYHFDQLTIASNTNDY